MLGFICQLCRWIAIFNPLLLYTIQRTCTGMEWVTKTRPNLSLPPVSTFWLTGEFDTVRNPNSRPCHSLLCRLHRNNCSQLLQLSCKTTKPTLHYLSLSDFDTFIHAKLWGAGVQFRSVQTCVTCVWPECHSDASDLTVSLSASCLSHVFKACLTDRLSVTSIYPRSWLIANDDSLRELLVRFPDKLLLFKHVACVPYCSYLLLGPLVMNCCLVCGNVKEKKVTHFLSLLSHVVEACECFISEFTS